MIHRPQALVGLKLRFSNVEGPTRVVGTREAPADSQVLSGEGTLDVVRLLGFGGTKAVYLVRHVEMDKEFAIAIYYRNDRSPLG